MRPHPHIDNALPNNRILLRLLAAFLSGCALFGAMGAAAVLLELIGGDEEYPVAFSIKLWARLLVLGLVAVAGCVVLWRKTPMSIESSPVLRSGGRTVTIVALLVLVGTLLFGGYGMGASPRTEPDELHHLMVARNLALEGQYASGHPDDKLIPFDSYDSVGAPVIIPVAAAFTLFGVGLESARGVLVVYTALSALLVLFAVWLRFGPMAGLLSTLFFLFVGGTWYLGRSLYGEVPSFAMLLAGIMFWGQSIRMACPKRRIFYALLAGALFGLAILTKTILLLTAFMFLTVVIFDRCTYRNIGLSPIIFPGIGVITVIGYWWGYKALSLPSGATEAPGNINMYSAYVLIGLQSAIPNILGIASTPLRFGLSVVALAAGLWHTAVRRYDPAALALLLIALFYWQWYVLYTPGHLGRYQWYSYAIAAVALGPLCAHAVDFLLSKGSSLRTRKRTWMTLLLLCAFAHLGAHIYQEHREFHRLNVTLEDKEIAKAISAIPPTKRIATVYWPLSRVCAFFADRYVPIVEGGGEALTNFDVILFNAETQQAMFPDVSDVERIGRYGIIRRQEGSTP